MEEETIITLSIYHLKDGRRIVKMQGEDIDYLSEVDSPEQGLRLRTEKTLSYLKDDHRVHEQMLEVCDYIADAAKELQRLLLDE